MTDNNRNFVITDGTPAGHPVHAVAWWADEGPPPPYVISPHDSVQIAATAILCDVAAQPDREER